MLQLLIQSNHFWFLYRHHCSSSRFMLWEYSGQSIRIIEQWLQRPFSSWSTIVVSIVRMRCWFWQWEQKISPTTITVTIRHHHLLLWSATQKPHTFVNYRQWRLLLTLLLLLKQTQVCMISLHSRLLLVMVVVLTKKAATAIVNWITVTSFWTTDFILRNCDCLWRRCCNSRIVCIGI